jgi:hypothetical protein
MPLYCYYLNGTVGTDGTVGTLGTRLILELARRSHANSFKEKACKCVRSQ